jgi:signal transduction histidine kinase/ActR/RegA family two-component response regulator
MTTPSTQLPPSPRFGLRRQAATGAILWLVAVVGATAFAHYCEWRLNTSARQTVEIDAPQGMLAQEVAFEAAQCCRFEEKFLAVLHAANAPEERRAASASWQASYDKLQEALDRLAELASQTPEWWRLAQCRDGIEGYRTCFLNVVREVEQGGLASPVGVRQRLDDCNAPVEELVAAAGTFAASRLNAARAGEATLRSATAQRQRLVNLRGIIALLALVLCILWFSRGVLGRIRVLSDTVLRFTSGDWRVRLVARGGDELDTLAWQYNQMAAAVQTGHEQLERAREVAEAENRAKSEFLAKLAKEIRLPVTVSLGYAEMLMGNLADGENLDAAATIKRNNEYVIEALDDLRDLSQIEVGRLRVEPGCCSPRQVVTEVLSAAQVRADAKGLSLAAEYDGPIPEQIRSDASRLRQILANLVANAVKFTEIGTVRLIVRLLDDNSGEPRLRFQVVDPGVGMTQPQIARLFQPITLGDAPAIQGLPAIGLGLTISKRLVEMLDGTIGVESIPGCGSTFTVTIPTGPLEGVPMVQPSAAEAVQAAEPLPSPPLPTPQVAAGMPHRILLAEDGRENRRLLSFILAKTGADVVTAEDGREAVDKVLPTLSQTAGPMAEAPFDLILMDMQMPVMDGYEAARQLRQAGYAGPIVAVTGHTRNYDRRRCLEAGCDDYLAKPVDRKDLLDMVARHLRGAEQPVG